MSDGATPALGLTIGATNLAAVTADRTVVRKPVLTLYQQRPPEVGVPSENPRLDEPGLVITGFVDRVGDPIGIVAADGSVHRSEVLLANGLRSLAYAATNGSVLPANVAVTHPSHWGASAVEALGSALSAVSEWSNPARPITLIPDAAATLYAMRANPGIPARGTVAVCDFGGSGTSITLMDAAGDYQPLAPTVRHQDFSGDLIDQALLTTVMANVPSTGGFDPFGTSAIGSLSRLRAACRVAKEQLSSSTVTTLTEELPGVDGDIRLTRNELDDAIRDSLSNFVSVLDETLARNAIRDLVAVVSVGGGAHIPAVTTMLSGHFRVPVVTTPRPQLAAAIGAALRAARAPGDTSATALTPAAAAGAAVAAPVVAPVPPAAVVPPAADAGKSASTEVRPAGPVSAMMPALAWSEADDSSRGIPAASGSGYTSARPALNFEGHSEPRPEKKKKTPNPILPWHRLPGMVVIGTAVAVLLVGIAVAIGFSGDKAATTPVPGVSTPAAPAPASGGTPQSAPANPAPAGQSVPPAPQVAPAQPADAGPPAAADPPADVPQAPVPQAPAPPPVPQVPQAPPIPPRIPQIPGIPAIPHIPGISLSVPGFGPIG